MNILNLSDNIVRLRRKKGVTQEELADFVGVTKASVSKWETKQSMPDILLLPQLAAYFNVTTDELLGYEPQLSKEQIQKIYHDLAAGFAQLSFGEAMENSRVLVKKYYSCYPFLYQICLLWVNHFMLAQEQELQIKVLNEAVSLCGHILSDCGDLNICSDTVILKALIDLQCGKAREVIESLEGILDPGRISRQSDTILIQAYQLDGNARKADSFAQISMFTHLTLLAGSMVQYMAMHAGDPAICDETIRRLDLLVEAFDLEHLHPNTSLGYFYQAAVIYCQQEKIPEALERIRKYVSCVSYLLTGDHLKLGGDSYFCHLEEWFEGMDSGTEPPRARKIILDSTVQALNHPAFKVLDQVDEFRKLKRKLMDLE